MPWLIYDRSFKRYLRPLVAWPEDHHRLGTNFSNPQTAGCWVEDPAEAWIFATREDANIDGKYIDSYEDLVDMMEIMLNDPGFITRRMAREGASHD